MRINLTSTDLRRYVCWLAGENFFHDIVAACGFATDHFDASSRPGDADLDILIAKASLRLGFQPGDLVEAVSTWTSKDRASAQAKESAGRIPHQCQRLVLSPRYSRAM
jgi:hypothetical protein